MENGISHFEKLKWKLKRVTKLYFLFSNWKTIATCTSLSAALVVSIISDIKNLNVSGESAPSVMPVGHPWDYTSVATSWHFSP